MSTLGPDGAPMFKIPDHFVRDGGREGNTPKDVFGPLTIEHKASGATLYQGGLLMPDGANLWFLSGPGWERWAAIRPETGFALEEVFTGDVPEPMREGVEDIWAKTIESMRKAGKEADRELAEEAERAKVELRLSPKAAVFLRGMVQHINQAKVLPEDDEAALTASAALEEIEAAVVKAMGPGEPEPA